MLCRYRWTRNGYLLNMNDESIHPANDGTGSFHIEPVTTLHEGSYVCKAETQYGTAVSSTSLIQQAVLTTDRTTVRNFTETAGEPFHIPVGVMTCFPPASFRWVTAPIVGSKDATSGQNVHTDQRIQISDTGKLMYYLPHSLAHKRRTCNGSACSWYRH